MKRSTASADYFNITYEIGLILLSPPIYQITPGGPVFG